MILFREVVSTKFHRFKIVNLCTTGCRLTMPLLVFIVYLSISFCFTVKKLLSAHYGLAAVFLKFPAAWYSLLHHG